MNLLKRLSVAVVIGGAGLAAGGCTLLGMPPISHPLGATDASVSVRNQAQLQTDGSVVLTVDYVCLPGPGGDTVGTLKTLVNEDSASFGSETTVQANCDGQPHVGVTDNTNPPGNSYHDGQGQAFANVANVANSAGDGAGWGGPVTITG
jgi:hypothetical protein